MNLAYLLNSYPMTSTTFIRSEIEELEALGQPVKRFGVRRWDVPLVDPDDLDEQRRTEYLLSGNVGGLLLAAILEPLRNLRKFLGTLPLLWHVLRQSRGGGLLKHVSYLLQAIFLRQRACALGIDHIHTHFSTNATTVAMLANALGGPSYSFTVHGPDELVEPWRNSLRKKVANAAFVVAITNYCRMRIENESPGYEGKIRVIRCGIDLKKFVPDVSGMGQTGRFTCVGRLCVNKAQFLIPAAVAMVREEFPNIVIELVGDGEGRLNIEEEIRRYGVQDNVRLSGWASAEMVREKISQSAALLLPSLAEGLPIVLMEALALERPVLTTFIAGIPELIDSECGWIFPAGSVEALADALRASLRATPKTLNALGVEGRRRIQEHHNVTRSSESLLENFRALSGS